MGKLNFPFSLLKQGFVYDVAAIKNKLIKWLNNYRGERRRFKERLSVKCFSLTFLPSFCSRFERSFSDNFETVIKRNFIYVYFLLLFF